MFNNNEIYRNKNVFQYICYVCITVNIFKLQMSNAPKNFKEECVLQVFKAAYRIKLEWSTLLSERLYMYFQNFAQAYNCPMTLSVPTMLTLIAAVVGPQTKMSIRKNNFVVPLNLYSFLITSPGGGKSVGYAKLVEPSIRIVEELGGYDIQVETYTAAGLQRMQMQCEGRALLVSDEGHRVLANINAKQGRSEGERALLNKLWGGKGDTTVLREEDRGFKSTSFSMALYIQPCRILSELSIMGGDDGFLDRLLFFAAKPHMHSTKEMMSATRVLVEDFADDLMPTIIGRIFERHREGPTLYEFEPAAQRYYDELSDEHAAEYNSKYASSGK